VTKQAAAQLVEELVRKGYVERHPHPHAPPGTDRDRLGRYARRRSGSPGCRRTVARSAGSGALQRTGRRPDTPWIAGTDPPCLVSQWSTVLETAGRERTVRQANWPRVRRHASCRAERSANR
jgi:hypothetical protein